MNIDQAYGRIATLQSQLAASQKRVDELEAELTLKVRQIKGYMGIEARLRNELAASKERERILREGLSKIILLDEDSGWPYEVGDYEHGIISGREEAADIARDTFKAAEEVK